MKESLAGKWSLCIIESLRRRRIINQSESVFGSYSLRRMEEKDLDSVLLIENVSFPHPWRRTTFIGELSNLPFSEPFVIVFGSEDDVAGYIILWKIREEIQISNFAVHPEHRRAGLGEAVLRHMLKRCESRGAEEIFLEVRPSNRAAIKLYEKLGFQILGVRKNYYRSPVEDALIMGKSLVQ